jgi:hypothetical protein
MRSLNLTPHRIAPAFALIAVASLILLASAGRGGADHLVRPVLSPPPGVADGNSPAAQPATVILPEPDTWGLMISGMFLAGQALRRRRRVRS